jgi:hypothetical protein
VEGVRARADVVWRRRSCSVCRAMPHSRSRRSRPGSRRTGRTSSCRRTRSCVVCAPVWCTVLSSRAACVRACVDAAVAAPVPRVGGRVHQDDHDQQLVRPGRAGSVRCSADASGVQEPSDVLLHRGWSVIVLGQDLDTHAATAGCHIALGDHVKAKELLDQVPKLLEGKKIGGKDLPTEVFIKKRCTFRCCTLSRTVRLRRIVWQWCSTSRSSCDGPARRRGG